MTIDDAAVRDIALQLLAGRAAGASLCPSEVARAVVAAKGHPVGPADWRAVMPDVHAVIDRLVADDVVALSWKGRAVSLRVGPYRISWKDSRYATPTAQQQGARNTASALPGSELRLGR